MFKRWFHRMVLRRRWLTFVVMAVSFFVFGTVTFNLFFLMKANFDLLAMHGWQAAMDGGLAQALELIFSGVLAMAAYVIFKSCEHRLVHWLVAPELTAPAPGRAGRSIRAQPINDSSDPQK